MDQSSTALAAGTCDPSPNRFGGAYGVTDGSIGTQPDELRPVGTPARGAVGLGLSDWKQVTQPTPQKPPWTRFDKRLQRLRRLRRSIGTAGDSIAQRPTSGHRIVPVMVTLTYAQAWLWEPRQVSRLVADVRQYCERNHDFKPSHVWVMELQQRGAPHYHVVFWLRADITLPKPDKAGWWPWGFTRIEAARKPVGYLLKYVSKLETKDGHGFPPSARIHGRGGLSQGESRLVAWWVLPRYQRVRCTPDDRATRARGGGWVSRESGEWWPPWDGLGHYVEPPT